MIFEIEIPIFHEHRKNEILKLITEVMDKLGVWQYNLKVNNKEIEALKP